MLVHFFVRGRDRSHLHSLRKSEVTRARPSDNDEPLATIKMARRHDGYSTRFTKRYVVKPSEFVALFSDDVALLASQSPNSMTLINL